MAWVILSDTLQAASSTLQAALAAHFRAGLDLGIIIMATAPAAAPTPRVMAKPFAFIFLTSTALVCPGKKIFELERFLLCSGEKV